MVFSPKARNTFSTMVLRYLWCSVMKELTTKSDTLFIFVDEAAVVLGKCKRRARGFYSVIPIVNRPLTTKKLTILAAIIPGFRLIYKWFEKSVNSHQYSIFLREISYICRTRLCNKNTQIILIQDNCPIHKTIEVSKEAKKIN